MQNDAAMLQCSNEYCKAPNDQTDKFCQLCATPLIKRYLWAVEEIEAYQIGSLVGDRYLLKSNRILLDTKPGLLPETAFPEISDAIKPYLRLIPYQLHIPQVYGLVSLGEQKAKKILLLEQAPISTEPLPVGLMPELTRAWKDATSMRQLNWLWQMATLWQPLWTEGVASSLLAPLNLRIEGSLVRLLQLQPDQAPPTLAQLGQLWSQLIATSQPSITELLEQLCHALVEREIQTIDKLISVLEQGVALLAPCVQSTMTIATSTDKGPSRERNEDACYPASGAIAIHTNREPALAIVCDGIGGHEGGNVASNLAIETIQQQIQQLPLNDSQLDASTLSNQLERSARVANDKINQRNDNEHRHGRQRMGTTLVIALARAYEMYITHVGDSRAYLITRTGCHQVTLDDDVAAREVRLGYALYREALQQSASGSLVQALGTSSSASLHPTVQRFTIDEDCVFLLCSDGLSDYDRVEQSWETEILPILDGKVDLATASQRLVEIGNTQNGHDNVTVALVHCQVKFSEPESKLSPSIVATTLSISESPAMASGFDSNTLKPTNTASSKLKTQLLPSEPASRRFFLPMLLGLVLVVSLGGGLLAYLSKQRKLPGWAGSSPIDVQSPQSSVSPSLEPQNVSAVNSLQKGALIQTRSDLVLSRISLRPNSAIASQQKQRVNFTHGTIPGGSVLQVLDNKPVSQQDYWLNLKVCSTPATKRSPVTTKQNKINTVRQSGNVPPSSTISPANLNPSTSRLLQPQDKGWIRAAEIEPEYLPISSLESEQRFNCPVLTEKKLGNKASIGVRD